MTEGHVTVIVPAAGSGVRMGGPRKQFRMLGGATILVHTLRALRRCREVGSMVVALPSDCAATRFDSDLGVHAVTAGGATRQESVARAMQVLPRETTLVLVHDAVRPFVAAGDVRAVIAAAASTGAAALAVPAVDTMRYGVGTRFTRTVSRAGLYHMQTPQGFRRGILAKAIEVAGKPETDEVALVQRLGYPVTIVPGSRSNVKITTEDDWAWAGAYWRSRPVRQ